MKKIKLFTALAVVAPIVATVSTITSCSQKDETETQSAQEYIKDRTFGIAGLDQNGQWRLCGTGWIISDATKDSADDYTYWIATNWHVKYGIVDAGHTEIKTTGFHYDGMGNDVYQDFVSVTWENASKFEFDGSSTKSAIDFYVAKVNFANSASDLPAIAKTRLNNVNQYNKDHGYINKFVASSSSSNFTKNALYCGGYPAKKRQVTGGYTKTQMWNFENIAAGSDVQWKSKDTKYIQGLNQAGHSIDSEDTSTAKIWDVSANYYYNALFECTYDDIMETWIPNGWSLTGGASGSMLVTKQNNEWVVVGIYWGGWTLSDGQTPPEDVWFNPAWSMIKSTDKDFITQYL